MKPLRLAIAGGLGRTGSAVVRLSANDPRFALTAVLTQPDDPNAGKETGALLGIAGLAVPLSHTCDVPVDVLVEFSSPAGCAAWAGWCAAHGVPFVSGTTGLGEREQAELRTAAQRVPLVWAPNMSVGVNVLLQLVADVATKLGPEWDVEIVEAHHRHKVDAPSGTARALLAELAQSRDPQGQVEAVHGRVGTTALRRSNEIGVHALRLGETVGEHRVILAAAHEELELRHRALSRDAFAAGALRAAQWVVGRRPGLYSMRDVLAG